VQGTVSLAGKPLTAGTVVFKADGRSYTGAIGADGRYALRYLGQPGVLPGDYRIAVVPPVAELVADPKTTELKAVNPPKANRRSTSICRSPEAGRRWLVG